MRKIKKSTNIPDTLVKAPVPNNADQVQESIYKAEEVRIQLCEDQYYKCAYCECKITKMYNDVEHYRPKSMYYWLGHDWANLLYACPICNRSYKKAQFPLKDELMRVKAPGNLANENPLIINPVAENPINHIKFNRHIMVGITDEGKKTIALLHLNDRANRAELLNERERIFELYLKEKEIYEGMHKLLNSQNLTQEYREQIKKIIAISFEAIQKYKSIDALYSGMLISQI